MKFLLVAVNTKFIHSNPAVRVLREYVLSHDPSVSADEIGILESTINNSYEEVLSDIYLKKPEVVLFSCYIWNWAFIKKLSREVAKVLPEAIIWAGGPEVSFDAEAILAECPWIRGIMTGEGEESFLFLVQAIRRGEDVSGILRGEDAAMGQLPFIYTDENIAAYQNKILYYETSRGCPFSCSYCLSSVKGNVRLRPWEMVEKELAFFVRHRVKQVKFTDRTFNCDHVHCQRIWKWIKEHDNGVTNFHFEIAGDLLNEDEIALLSGMRPNLVQLEIGVQSTNPETITEIRRKMDLNKLASNVEKIRSFSNIHQHLDLIAGLPYEDLKSFRKSFDDVYRMKPDQLQLGFLKVLKGSYMAEKVADYEINYTSEAPYEVLSTKWLSFADVIRLKKVEAVLELFYNSRQFTAVLPLLEQCFNSSFDLYDRMAEYYETEGFFLNSPSRAYRYQILLDFAASIEPLHIDLYREALTFDLYLREKAKSRPAFALDLKPYQKVIRQQYDEGLDKRCHVDVFSYAVWEDGAPKLPEKALVAFDYEKKDPLDHNASVTVIGYLQEENHLL